MHHRVVFEKSTGHLSVYSITDYSDQEIIFVRYKVVDNGSIDLSFDELARRLGEDILIGTPDIREIYKL